MKNTLENFITKNVKNPKVAEIKAILDIFEEKTLKKNDFFKRPFKKSKEFAFLAKGSLRLILHKDDGEKATIRLLLAPAFITDIISIETKQATPIGIECLENVVLLVAPLEKVKQLLEVNLAFNILIRKYVIEKAIEMGKHHILFLTGNAKERYQFILKNNPELLRKFPLHIIASLIGITPTQLSRIRNKKEK